MAVKLYQYEACPFCWKVRVALALKKQPYEKVEVHPLNKKELDFSTYKKVPVYINTQGQQINDSTQIMRSLDSEFAEPILFEKDATRAHVENEMLAWSERYVRSIPPLIYANLGDALKAFDYITKTPKFSLAQKYIVKYSGALVMKMVAKKTSKELNIENPKNYFEGFLNEWVSVLKGQKFLGGDKPNGADAAVYGITMSVSGLPASRVVFENSEFSKWVKHMGQSTQIEFQGLN